MNTLHKNDYDITSAFESLVPATGPVLCRDEMEEWAASEANLFDQAQKEFDKDFNAIRIHYLPWKSLVSIIEYYYLQKTTNRYVQHKKRKAQLADNKLKQVYIPEYNKSISLPGRGSGKPRSCEGCNTTNSKEWFPWGPVRRQYCLCGNCWIYWKKYGALKTPSRLGRLYQLS